MDISDFYAGKSVFLTGVTGFMGKVLLEKILRCLNVTAVYVLIRQKKGMTAQERMQKLFEAPLFQSLLASNPESITKVIPIEGNTSLPSFGICDSDLRVILAHTSVVFHCAASVKFQEALIDAIDANVRSVQGIIDLARNMKKFEVLIYLSTAYAHCYRPNIDETIYSTDTRPDDILKCADWMSRDMMEKLVGDLCRDHPNTYTYTKALAENLISESSLKRSVIVRPSIVISAWKEPFPGWCDSINGPVGLIISFGKGLLRTMLGKRESVANFVPVDVAINLMIAGGWKSATSEHFASNTHNMTIYNCTNPDTNAFSWGDLSDCVTENAKLFPLANPVILPAYDASIGPSYFKYRLQWAICHWIPAYIADFTRAITGKNRKFVSLYTKIRVMCDSLSYFTMRSWTWSNKNMRELLASMTPIERKIFYIDFSDLDWKRHMTEYHAGVKKYILKEKLEDIPQTMKHLNRLKYLWFSMKSLLVILLLLVLYKYGLTSEVAVAALSFILTIHCSLHFLGSTPTKK